MRRLRPNRGSRPLVLKDSARPMLYALGRDQLQALVFESTFKFTFGSFDI